MPVLGSQFGAVRERASGVLLGPTERERGREGERPIPLALWAGNLFKIGATQLEQKDCVIQLMLMIREEKGSGEEGEGKFGREWGVGWLEEERRRGSFAKALFL